jgi:hypothetical protein
MTECCVARRHIDAAAFKTYDAMMSMAAAGEKKRRLEGKWKPGDPLMCWAKITTLANANNRGRDAEIEAIDKLEDDGWIISTHGKRRRKSRAGTLTTNEWRVLNHEEHAAAHPGSCPPPRYDETTGKTIKPSATPIVLDRVNARRELERVLGVLDQSVDNEALDIWTEAKRRRFTKSESSDVVTKSEFPDLVEVAKSEFPDVTKSEFPDVTTSESSDTSLTLSRTDSLPSIHPALENPESDKRMGGGMEGLEEKSKSTAMIVEEDPTPEEIKAEEESYKRHLEREWKLFQQALDDTDMAGAVLTKRDVDSLRKQVDNHGRDVVSKAIKQWLSERSMDVGGLRFPWGAWHREGEPYLAAEVKRVRDAMRHEKWKACVQRINDSWKPFGGGTKDFKIPDEFRATVTDQERTKLNGLNTDRYDERFLNALEDLSWKIWDWTERKQGRPGLDED